MKLLAIAILSEQLINAIGSTLIHSLWQGLVLVGLTGVIIVTTRSQKPSTRYNLLIATLFVFLLVNVTTFVNALMGIRYSQLDTHTTGLLRSDASGQVTHPENVVFFTQVKTYLTNYNQLIVLLWFLIVSARCFQLFIGLNGLNHLRRKSSFTVPIEWQVKMENFAKQLGIKQAIRIAECSLIRVPMVIGHLKPLILIPVGLLTALPPKEIEAILIHELAHIYRRDYLVNLFQNLMEIIFFFNPAVLWLSNLIKVERENCCDDIAIRETNNKVNYISALIACQEYQQNVPAYAMTFSKRGGLRERVQRLVGDNNTSLNSVEKSIFILCVIASGFGLLAFSNAPKLKKMINSTTSSIQATIMKPIGEKLIVQDSLKRLHMLKTSRVTTSSTSSSTQGEILSALSPIDDQNHPRLAKLDSIDQSLKIISDSLGKLSSKLTLSPTKVGGRLPKLSVTLPAIAAIEVQNPPTLGEQVIQEFIKDSLIVKIDKQLSFKLSSTELIVNGKKQPQEIYQKYKDKYVPEVGKGVWTMYYNYHTSG